MPTAMDAETKKRIVQSEQFIVLRVIADYASKHPNGVPAISVWSYALENYRAQLTHGRLIVPLGDTLAELKRLQFIEEASAGYRVTIHGQQALLRSGERRALRTTQENPPVSPASATAVTQRDPAFAKTVTKPAIATPLAGSFSKEDDAVTTQMSRPAFLDTHKDTILGVGSMGALKPTNQGRRLRINTKR